MIKIPPVSPLARKAKANVNATGLLSVSWIDGREATLANGAGVRLIRSV